MQLSRIKGMSGKRKMAWLEAIYELEKDYRNDMQDYLNCPLCAVPEECDGCLWPIIEGCECTAYEWGDDYVGVPQRWEKNYKEWKTHRLKMLDIWKKIITIYVVMDSMVKIFKALRQDFKEEKRRKKWKKK